jgi:SAM-dependent methyltransferase
MVSPSVGDTVWSPYQKLVGHHMSAEEVENIAGFKAPAYLVQISDVFYQVAMDLRPEAIASIGANPFPHYDRSYERLSKLDRVLVVGAGTGNDVAAALRAGVKQVDAVDIDPAIIDLGRKHHPEQPYSDPRVNVIIEDARAAFRTLPSASYDAVVFGLLDSHTQLGISSLRLDNYVFTLESLREARRLLKPGGSIVLTAVTFREWFHDRFVGMLEATCGSPVTVTPGVWSTYECQPRQFSIPAAATGDDEATLPTDDWPFLYLPNASIPTAYVLALTMLAIASIVFLRLGGLTTGRLTSSQATCFSSELGSC